jgi:hypothetical protein
MRSPNRPSRLTGARHVAVPYAVTERHVAHYRADLALKRRAWLTGGARSTDGYSQIPITGSEPTISLEGAKAGPRPGFDSRPRATEQGTTKGAPVHGQGSSHALEAPQDVFEAKGRGRRRNPLGGGTEPSDPVEGNRHPHDHSLAFLRAPPGHKPTPNDWSTDSHSNLPVSSSPEIVGTRPNGGSTAFPTPPPPS